MSEGAEDATPFVGNQVDQFVMKAKANGWEVREHLLYTDFVHSSSLPFRLEHDATGLVTRVDRPTELQAEYDEKMETKRMARKRGNRWIVVEGQDATPDGRRDEMLWEGRSIIGAIKAVRAGHKNDMSVCVRVYLPWKHENY